MTRKSIVTILIVVLIIAAIITVTVTSVLAIWKKNDHDSLYVNVPVTDENPSLKYQMYVPVLTNGSANSSLSSTAFTKAAGTYSITNGVYSYTLDPSVNVADIVGYAFVGYFGGVALEYVEFPSQYTMTFDGTAVTKPVVRIMASPSEFSDYSLKGNDTIKALTIGYNVREIDTGVFFNMRELATVTYIAPPAQTYSDAATYEVGSMVVHDARYFICISGVENAAWDETHWREMTLYVRSNAFAYCPKMSETNSGGRLITKA